MTSPSRGVFTPKQIADICHVAERNVLEWISKGDLPAWKKDGYRVDREVLIEFLKNGGMENEAESI